MSVMQINNTHVKNYRKLITINDLRNKIPLTDKASETIFKGRQDVFDILDSKDDRFVVIIGPCSIHDPAIALDYASRLMKLKSRLPPPAGGPPGGAGPPAAPP